MRWISALFTIAALLAVQTASGQQTAPKPKQESAKKKGRVNAVDPTVVTVQGRVTPAEKDRNFIEKIGHGISSGVTGAGKAAANAVGWLLDPKNEIPSDKERQDQAAKQSSNP